MMRVVSVALAAVLGSAVSAIVPPTAAAQVTYAPEVDPLVAPPAVVVLGTRYRVVARSVLVPRTRYVRRAVLVPRIRYVRRVIGVPVTTYVRRTNVATYPLGPYGVAAPVSDDARTYVGTGLVGPTWVPPGTTYPCVLGTVGCDSSVVGRMAF